MITKIRHLIRCFSLMRGKVFAIMAAGRRADGAAASVTGPRKVFVIIAAAGRPTRGWRGCGRPGQGKVFVIIAAAGARVVRLRA
jgi:hypothetical protein